MRKVTITGSAVLLLSFGAAGASAQVASVGFERRSQPDLDRSTSLQSAAEGQSGLLEKPARLQVKNVRLLEALTELARSAEVPLVFSPSLLANPVVSCDCQTRQVGEALDFLLSGTGSGYSELAGHVVIEQSPPASQTAASEVALAGIADGRWLTNPRFDRLPVIRRQGTITGTVHDAQTGAPLEATQVQLFAEEAATSTRETLTASTGTFTLTNVPAGVYTVVVRRLGYHEGRQTGVTVEAGQTSTVDFLLNTAALQLDEIVVVGYGEQVAANVTGSVSRASAVDVARVAAPTVGQALQGHAPGVFIKNLNAQPGVNKIDINIRGFGEPLFIVDGQEVDTRHFQEINADDIEDIVVLKDAAAAAVYGARAGNGVVLITTRRGAESAAPRFSYSSDFSAQFMTVKPPMAESWEHMQFDNLRREHQGLAPIFTQERIDNSFRYRDNSNPDYPNTQIMDHVLRDYAPMQQHNLSIRGGTETVRYYVSGSWMEQRGILASDEIDYNRFNIRSNLDLALTDRLDVGLDLAVVNRVYEGPFYELQGSGTAPFDADQMYFRMLRWKPYWAFEPQAFENGLLRGVEGGTNPNAWNYMWREHGGHRDWTDQTGTARVSLSYRLPYNFEAGGTFAFVREAYDWQMFKRRLEEYEYDAATDSYDLVRVPGVMTLLRERRDRENRATINYQLRNSSVFGNHALSGLLLFEQTYSHMDRVEAWRLDYPVDIPYLFAGPDLDKDNLGFARESGRQGIVGRLNYGYAGRYSAELNFRYDGSSAFPEGSRWGFFPSFSGAWNISEESFIRDSRTFDFVDAFRIRASAGRLGFDRAGDWQHLATYSFTDAGRYIYGPAGISAAIQSDELPNPHITWEKMDLTNVGINFDLWGGLLSGEFDAFRRTRSDVLGTRAVSLPNVVGAELPQENLQKFRNQGWDASVMHANMVRDVGYRLGVTVSRTREKTLFTDTRPFLNMEDRRRNDPIGQYTGRVWRMPVDGLFTSQEEIDNWADIDGRNNATVQLGDLRFVDTNGDGRITIEDAIVAGSDATPKFTFGFQAGANWRGLELFMMWQGAAAFGHDLMNTAIFVQPNHFNNNNIGRHIVEDSYVPENQWGIPVNTDATYPCACADGSGATGNHSYEGIGGGAIGRADFWFADGKYLRLRNLQLAYTLPDRLINRIGVDRARLTLSGYNLLTFYKYDFIDPEYDTNNMVGGRTSPQADGSGTNYPGNHHPSMGSYSFGFEVSF